MINNKVGVSGRFKVQVLRSDGSVRMDRDWQKNLITNYGMDHLSSKHQSTVGQANMMQYIRVGTGSSTPANTDVALANQVGYKDSAGQSTRIAPVATDASPYCGWRVRYEFAAGAVVGNLTELGVSHSAEGNNLCTHAQFLDSNGQPITVVVAADEQLIITYEFRLYFPTTASSASVTDPNTGTVYTIRALPVNTINWNWADYILGGVLGGQIGNSVNGAQGYAYYGSGAGLSSAVSPVPNGTNVSGTFNYNTALATDGSYSTTTTVTVPLGSLNDLDIKVVQTTEMSPSYFAPLSWQFEFTPTWRKTSDQTVTFTIRLEIARV
ncbi:tail fiber protein [Xylella phage Paz]|uniref:Tail fiber protein n=1 Tax=Xylella phage Paz TaxID=1415145 RepID=V5Q7R9_9CAUD|nr:tail fiber protein [Xylella phage Paz]AHB12138.1 tail fiber protein [Xylella phage Paz]